MAKELELKLAVPSPALLEQVLFDKDVAAVRLSGYHMLDMATVYYDTPDAGLSQKRWTLRLRQENERLVATCKTPAQGLARNEYECDAPTIEAALPKLVEAGAPAELLEIDRLIPLCAAQFTRREAVLSFADGTSCLLCGDIGMLAGGQKQKAFCEVELELREGDFETVKAFGEELKERFGLTEEPKSKFARAAALAVAE